jgi:hypothetical protein
MRYLVYLLLVANVLYTGWHLFGGNPATESRQRVPAAPAGVRSLVMLDEREVRSLPESDGRDGAEPDSIEKATAGRDTGQESRAEPVGQETPGTQSTALCKALGPFTDSSTAEAVSGHLAGKGLEPLLHTVDSRVVDDYWVYVPGQGKQHAHEVIRKLKAKDFNDYFVFDADDYLVSLGTFRKIELAEKQLATLHALGVEAVLETRYKTRVEHWLEMTVAAAQDVKLELIANNTPGLQINTDTCAALASH